MWGSDRSLGTLHEILVRKGHLKEHELSKALRACLKDGPTGLFDVMNMSLFDLVGLNAFAQVISVITAVCVLPCCYAIS